MNRCHWNLLVIHPNVRTYKHLPWFRPTFERANAPCYSRSPPPVPWAMDLSLPTDLEGFGSRVAGLGAMSLSVVVPNFNHARLLPRAIAALLRQQEVPSEIIIVDDGSTDDSIAIIEGFTQKSDIIKLIRHEKNLGAPAALNTGLRAAIGDFIYFAAADDYALPELFATAVAALKANPRAAFFCGVSVLVNPQGVVVGFRPFMVPADRAAYLSPNDVRRILCSSDNWAVGSTVIFRRLRLLEAGELDETMGALCDGILVRRLALKGRFCFDPIIGAAWEVYPESLSARSALSVSESLRLIDKATHEVRFNFPRDVCDSYAEKINRRLRFNMARLWLVFEKGK